MPVRASTEQVEPTRNALWSADQRREAVGTGRCGRVSLQPSNHFRYRTENGPQLIAAVDISNFSSHDKLAGYCGLAPVAQRPERPYATRRPLVMSYCTLLCKGNRLVGSPCTAKREHAKVAAPVYDNKSVVWVLCYYAPSFGPCSRVCSISPMRLLADADPQVDIVPFLPVLRRCRSWWCPFSMTDRPIRRLLATALPGGGTSSARQVPISPEWRRLLSGGNASLVFVRGRGKGPSGDV